MVARSLFVFAVVASISLHQQFAGAQEPSSPVETLSPAKLAVVNYAYYVFPQQLAAAERHLALAEYEAAFWQQRVRSFEPTRSFGTYGATYFADQSAQLQAFAAEQQAECARQRVTNLWRERQATVAALMMNVDP